MIFPCNLMFQFKPRSHFEKLQDGRHFQDGHQILLNINNYIDSQMKVLPGR